MKFGQLIEYDKKNIFLKDHAENQTGRLVPELFLILKKKQKEVVLTYFGRPRHGHTIKRNCTTFEAVDPKYLWNSSILIF